MNGLLISQYLQDHSSVKGPFLLCVRICRAAVSFSAPFLMGEVMYGFVLICIGALLGAAVLYVAAELVGGILWAPLGRGVARAGAVVAAVVAILAAAELVVTLLQLGIGWVAVLAVVGWAGSRLISRRR
jgi:hypothetical protein